MAYEYTSPLKVLKSVGPKTVPFFKTVAIFFVLYPTDDENYNPVIFCLFKILPIASLIVFVLLHGMDFSEAYSYSWKILIGLMFSALGDIFLVFKNFGFFTHGIAAFALAQVMYAWAFDIWPLKLYIGAIVAAVASTLYLCVLPALNGPLVYFCLVYFCLISIMLWRAIARVQFFNDNWVFTPDLWKWTKLCSCIGAFFFALSDAAIAIDKFVAPIPYSHAVIMVTYYIAQFHVTVSVVDSQVDEVLRITREESEGTYSGHLIRKIQEEAREPVQKIREGVASATQRIESSESVQKIRQGIAEAQHRIESSEPVQIIRQGITRIETSDTVQIIRQGINRIETSEPVQRLRHRLTSRHEPEEESTQEVKQEMEVKPETISASVTSGEEIDEAAELYEAEPSLLTHRPVELST